MLLHYIILVSICKGNLKGCFHFTQNSWIKLWHMSKTYILHNMICRSLECLMLPFIKIRESVYFTLNNMTSWNQMYFQFTSKTLKKYTNYWYSPSLYFYSKCRLPSHQPISKLKSLGFLLCNILQRMGLINIAPSDGLVSGFNVNLTDKVGC